MSDLLITEKNYAGFDDIFGDEKKEKKTLPEVINDSKSQGEISGDHFKKLLDMTNITFRQIEKEYLDIAKEKEYARVYLFLNKKPKAFKKEITDDVTMSFIRYLDDNHAIFWRGKKLPKSVAIAIQSAFKIVSGHTYTSFLNVMKSKVYDGFGRETLKAINYLKLSNLRLNDKASYHRVLEDKETVNKVMEENPALFYPSFSQIGFKGLNQYQDFKAYLMSQGLTKKGWKFMCSQSKNYNLRAMRKIHVGIFCLNNGLKDAWLRNKFLSAWLLREELRNKSDVLIKEIQNYKGFVKDFEPFEVRSRKMGLSINYECTEIDQIDDYLKDDHRRAIRNNREVGIEIEERNYKENSKTLFQLLRRSNAWHEESFSKEKGKLKNFEILPLDKFEKDGFEFEQITNSWDLKKEGDKMHHCVFTYSQRCYEDKYAVFTVSGASTKKDKSENERATLGVSINRSFKEIEVDGVKVLRNVTTISFNQMYSYCNDSVSDEMHETAKTFLKELNKKIQSNKK